MRCPLAARTAVVLPLVALIAGCGEGAHQPRVVGQPVTATTPATPKPADGRVDDSASRRIGDPACKDLKPVSVTGGGSGPTTYIYRFDGTTVTQVLPAPGFDPTDASNTDLIKNGYPPRPTDSHRLALWRQLVKAKIVGPGLCINTTERAGPTAVPLPTQGS
jgi:hypothetical protein